jgi:hypothetical protein
MAKHESKLQNRLQRSSIFILQLLLCNLQSEPSRFGADVVVHLSGHLLPALASPFKKIFDFTRLCHLMRCVSAGKLSELGDRPAIFQAL